MRWYSDSATGHEATRARLKKRNNNKHAKITQYSVKTQLLY